MEYPEWSSFSVDSHNQSLLKSHDQMKSQLTDCQMFLGWCGFLSKIYLRTCLPIYLVYFFFYLVQSFWIFLFCLNSVLGKIVFYVFCKLLCKISHIWHFPQLSRCQRNESFHGTSFFLYLNHNKLVLCLWWGEFCASELEGNGHSFKNMKGLSWLWSYGSWIYKYLFNQCLSAL